MSLFFFFQAEDGIRDYKVTGVQTCALPIGVMRYGVRALAAVYQATVPWCSILIRRAYGVAAAGPQHMGRFNFRYARPPAHWGSPPIQGGLEVASKAEIEGADDRSEERPVREKGR